MWAQCAIYATGYRFHAVSAELRDHFHIYQNRGYGHVRVCFGVHNSLHSAFNVSTSPNPLP